MKAIPPDSILSQAPAKMPSAYEQLKLDLARAPQKWLVTGAAGFIGSHLVQELLALDQVVVGLDNFANGHRHNLADIQARVTPDQWSRFTLIEGDITAPGDCERACAGVSRVLHQAALGSVPRSLADSRRSKREADIRSQPQRLGAAPVSCP